MKTYLHIIGAMAIATSLTCAQDGPKGPKKPGKGRPNPEAIFKKLDADGSGAVSLDEFKAGPRGKENPEKAEEIFKKIDKDGNGELSLEEFKSHRPPHKGGPGKRGGDGLPPAE
ncbi:EF-hand domain-containing protein [Akkermansiaceae bacterium]|nr:EF-hand domain-containing protein [Akkermansiaceae bacterium]